MYILMSDSMPMYQKHKHPLNIYGILIHQNSQIYQKLDSVWYLTHTKEEVEGGAKKKPKEGSRDHVFCRKHLLFCI